MTTDAVENVEETEEEVCKPNPIERSNLVGQRAASKRRRHLQALYNGRKRFTNDAATKPFSLPRKRERNEASV